MPICAPPPVETQPHLGRSLIDELDLLTIPVSRWSSDQVLDVVDPDTRWTLSVTVSLTASVSVSWSW